MTRTRPTVGSTTPPSRLLRNRDDVRVGYSPAAVPPLPRSLLCWLWCSSLLDTITRPDC
jgi:hypothetical protein